MIHSMETQNVATGLAEQTPRFAPPPQVQWQSKTVAEEFTQSGAKLGSGPRLDDELRLHEEPL